MNDKKIKIVENNLFNIDVKKIRDKFGVTQEKFSEILGIPVATLRHWELGNRKPSGAALKLLFLVEKFPFLIFSNLSIDKVRCDLLNEWDNFSENYFLQRIYDDVVASDDLKETHLSRNLFVGKYFNPSQTYEVNYLISALEYKAARVVNQVATAFQVADVNKLDNQGFPKVLVDASTLLRDKHIRNFKNEKLRVVRSHKKSAKNKKNFQEWIFSKKDFLSFSGKVNINFIKSLEGFDLNWGSNACLKKWVKEIHKDFCFKLGR